MIRDRKLLALGRLLRFFAPTVEEVGFLSSIPGDERQVRPGELILAADAANEGFLLLDGWAANASNSAGGNQRMNTVNLPGDILGLHSLVLEEPQDQTYALTEVTVKQMPDTVMRTICEDYPRIAAVIMLIAQEEKAIKNEWNRLNAASAEKRFAGFLFRIGERLSYLNKLCGFDTNIPLTQRQFSDVVGVTPPYINQLIHVFEGQGLISYRRGHLKLLQPELLRKSAGLNPWQVTVPNWLPDPA